MIEVQIDEKAIKLIYEDKIAEALKDLDREHIFWDSKELQRRTCMSWNTLQEYFFHDPSFPKTKLGGKWYFPVEETKSFLKNWLAEQPRG